MNITASQIEKKYGVSARHAARDFCKAITGEEIRYGRTCKLYSSSLVSEILSNREKKQIEARKNYKNRPNIKLGTHSRLKKVLEPQLYLKLRNAWYGMMRRCYTEDRPDYHHYREYKIEVCDSWLKNFDEFALWALDHGVKKNLSLDRVNNNAGYSPENCRWVEKKIQVNNSSQNVLISYNGEEKTIAEWAETLGIKYGTLYARIITQGWNIEKALTTKVRKPLPRLSE